MEGRVDIKKLTLEELVGVGCAEEHVVEVTAILARLEQRGLRCRGEVLAFVDDEHNLLLTIFFHIFCISWILYRIGHFLNRCNDNRCVLIF